MYIINNNFFILLFSSKFKNKQAKMNRTAILYVLCALISLSFGTSTPSPPSRFAGICPYSSSARPLAMTKVYYTSGMKSAVVFQQCAFDSHYGYTCSFENPEGEGFHCYYEQRYNKYILDSARFYNSSIEMNYS